MTDWHVQVLARTIFGEARGEDGLGRVAVAAVIINRTKIRNISVAYACLQPNQFSCWNDRDPNLENLITVDEGNLAFKDCVMIARNTINGAYSDPTLGADHYFNPKLAAPKWAEEMTWTASIGRHEFYRS